MLQSVSNYLPKITNSSSYLVDTFAHVIGETTPQYYSGLVSSAEGGLLKTAIFHSYVKDYNHPSPFYNKLITMAKYIVSSGIFHGFTQITIFFTARTFLNDKIHSFQDKIGCKQVNEESAFSYQFACNDISYYWGAIGGLLLLTPWTAPLVYKSASYALTNPIKHSLGLGLGLAVGHTIAKFVGDYFGKPQLNSNKEDLGFLLAASYQISTPLSVEYISRAEHPIASISVSNTVFAGGTQLILRLCANMSQVAKVNVATAVVDSIMQIPVILRKSAGDRDWSLMLIHPIKLFFFMTGAVFIDQLYAKFWDIKGLDKKAEAGNFIKIVELIINDIVHLETSRFQKDYELTKKNILSIGKLFSDFNENNTLRVYNAGKDLFIKYEDKLPNATQIQELADKGITEVKKIAELIKDNAPDVLEKVVDGAEKTANLMAKTGEVVAKHAPEVISEVGNIHTVTELGKVVDIIKEDL